MTDLATAYDRLSGNARGALWMLASALMFTLMATLVKYLGANYPATVQAFFRGAGSLLVLAPVILRDPRAAFHATRPGILWFRAFAGTTAMILAFYSYQHMPLADANALSFTRALWLVPLAVFVLRERVGVWRTGAVAVGFAGVLIMLQPSAHGISASPATFAALASALLFATTVTGMKVLTRDHSITTLTVWTATLGVLLTAPLAVLEWRWPTLLDFFLLSAMGVVGLASQYCYIKGMSLGETAAMAPIDYTRLIFALLVGFVIFDEVPDLTTMFGALIVIAATLFITLREVRLKKPAPPVRPD